MPTSQQYLILQRGERERLVISRQEFKGVAGLDIRRHFRKKGESDYQPSFRGIRLHDNELKDVAETLASALKEMDTGEKPP